MFKNNNHNTINTSTLKPIMETIEETIEETVEETVEDVSSCTNQEAHHARSAAPSPSPLPERLERPVDQVSMNGSKDSESGNIFSGARGDMHGKNPLRKRKQSMSMSYWEEEIAKERAYNQSVRQLAKFFSRERREMHSNIPPRKRKHSISYWEEEIEKEREYNQSVKGLTMLGRERDCWGIWSSSGLVR
jgi:hypothetical protein